MEKRKTAASEQTKRTLAAALKELMAQKPIDKVTIHEIIMQTLIQGTGIIKKCAFAV